jgi:cytochrome c556
MKRIVLSFGLLMMIAAPSWADVDPIKTRQAGLDLLAGTVAGVKAVVAANGDAKALEAPGKAIKRWATTMPSLFPAGSDKGETKALPAIWSDQAGFEKASAALGSAADLLIAAAGAGDIKAAGDALKAVGDACGACHKAYRAK